MRVLKAIGLACLLVATVPAAAGCVHYTILTSAQLEQRGTRSYTGATREHVTDACATALGTLGYKVTVKDADTGLVKTAPSTIMVSATGGGNYANATEDGLAWAIVVEAAGPNAVVHATPRAFRNGSELHDKNLWAAEVMDAKFADLWREVDGMVGTAARGPQKTVTRQL